MFNAPLNNFNCLGRLKLHIFSEKAPKPSTVEAAYVIILGQIKSDNINRMVAITGYFLYALVNGTINYNNIKWMITLTSDNIKRFSL